MNTDGARKPAWMGGTVIFACVLIAAAPLLFRGNSCGHDFDFHLQSWLEVAQQWGQGVLYPRWVASANYGAGEPRLVFYPPASWTLGAVLGAIVGWKAAPSLFVLLCLGGAGAALYRLAREWLTPAAAAAAACLYVASPYMLFVVYERSALAELMAAVWIPLAILFTLRRNSSIASLALAVAALWLTNAPAAVMACYAVSLLAIIRTIQEKQQWPVVRVLIAIPLGSALAGFYLVPAAYERRWVEIERAIGPGMRVKDSFLFGHTGEPFHDQVLRTASWIAVALLATALVAGWRALRRQRTSSIPFCALMVWVTLLLLPVSELAWRWLPEMRFLQFPWRWLLVAGISVSFLAGAALGDLNSGRRPVWAWSIVLVIATVMSTIAWRFYWQPCDEEDAVSAQLETFAHGGFAGTDEYAARDADNSAIQQGLPPVRFVERPDADAASSGDNPAWVPTSQPARIVMERWTAGHKTFRVDSRNGGFVVLRLTDYPAWLVRVNGQPVANRPHRPDGLMTVPITVGESAVDVQYQRTPDVLWGDALSGVSLASLIVFKAKGKRRQRVRI